MPAPKNESVRRCLVKEINMVDSMIYNSERDQRIYQSKVDHETKVITELRIKRMELNRFLEFGDG